MGYANRRVGNTADDWRTFVPIVIARSASLIGNKVAAIMVSLSLSLFLSAGTFEFSQFLLPGRFFLFFLPTFPVSTSVQQGRTEGSLKASRSAEAETSRQISTPGLLTSQHFLWVHFSGFYRSHSRWTEDVFIYIYVYKIKPLLPHLTFIDAFSKCPIIQKSQVCNNWQEQLANFIDTEFSYVPSLRGRQTLRLRCLASGACLSLASLFALDELRDCTDVSTHTRTLRDANVPMFSSALCCRRRSHRAAAQGQGCLRAFWLVGLNHFLWFEVTDKNTFSYFCSSCHLDIRDFV